MKKVSRDLIPGGKADDKATSAFSSDQVAKGKKIEMEHTDNPAIAEEIATDHLDEFGDYYTALENMENKLKQGKTAAYGLGTRRAVLALIYG